MNLPDRTLAVLIPVVFVASSHLLWPDALRRAEQVYFCITIVGYGHLLGGAWFARPAFSAPAGAPPALWRAFVWTSVAVAFGVYGAVVESFGEAALASPLPILGLLAVSNWHVLENEFARRSGSPAGALPPISENRAGHRAALVGALAITLLAAASPEVREVYPRWAMPFVGPPFVDTFAILTGYHIVIWLLGSIRRLAARRAAGDFPAARRAARRLILVHALPLAVGLALLGAGRRGEELRLLVFGPAVYLFWSVLHVVQTALSRRPDSPKRFIPYPARSPRSILHASNAHDRPLDEDASPGHPPDLLYSPGRLPAAEPRAGTPGRFL